jgi:glyoxylase-like metal-dependent hydrolase (beta-lactamase superfamily II)
MKRTVILGTMTVAGLMLACLGGRQPEEMTIERLRDNLFVIAGNGGNTAVFVRRDGLVLVDTKFANSGQRLLDLIRTVSDKPITHIVNTHSHFDHVGSNSFFPDSVEVVAHENATGQMARMDEFADASAKHGLPDRTFKDTLTLFDGDEAIDLHHFGAAHTNNDAFVVFRAAHVMHAGDTFPGPNPVTRNGGSAEAYPATMRRAAEVLKGVDTVIPGHGAVTTWGAFLDNVNELQKR